LLLLKFCLWGKDEILSGRTPLNINRGIYSFIDLGVSSNLIGSSLLSDIHLLSIIHPLRSE